MTMMMTMIVTSGQRILTKGRIACRAVIDNRMILLRTPQQRFVMVKFGRVLWDIRADRQTEKQTDIHTDTLIQYFAHLSGAN